MVSKPLPRYIDYRDIFSRYLSWMKFWLPRTPTYCTTVCSAVIGSPVCTGCQSLSITGILHFCSSGGDFYMNTIGDFILMRSQFSDRLFEVCFSYPLGRESWKRAVNSVNLYPWHTPVLNHDAVLSLDLMNITSNSKFF